MLYPLEVLSSAAGWYIGQIDEDGLPYSRLSAYFHTLEEAEDSLETGFCLRLAPENLPIIKALSEAGVLNTSSQ